MWEVGKGALRGLVLSRCPSSSHLDQLLGVQLECHPTPSWIYPWNLHTPSSSSPLKLLVTYTQPIHIMHIIKQHVQIYYVINKLNKCSFVVIPCNEVDLAFLAILCRCEIKIIDSITTLISWQTGLKIVIGFCWSPYFVNHDLLLLNFEHNESITPLCFKLLELQFAFIVHSHSGRCICLHHIFSSSN